MSPRRICATLALLVLGAVAATPLASAAPADSAGFQLACDPLPLWDAAFCFANNALGYVNQQWAYVTCDVIGGPACGFNVCEDLDLCLE